MSNWYSPLCQEHYDFEDGSLKHFMRDNWFNQDGCVVMGEKGSMTKNIIPLFMRHLNAFVRTAVSLEKLGRASRVPIEYLHAHLSI